MADVLGPVHHDQVLAGRESERPSHFGRNGGRDVQLVASAAQSTALTQICHAAYVGPEAPADTRAQPYDWRG